MNITFLLTNGAGKKKKKKKCIGPTRREDITLQSRAVRLVFPDVHISSIRTINQVSAKAIKPRKKKKLTARRVS